MLLETEQTRAIRRAQHDTYAPYTVRPAVRGDLFDRMEVPINYAGAGAIIVFVIIFLAWAINACLH